MPTDYQASCALGAAPSGPHERDDRRQEVPAAAQQRQMTETVCSPKLPEKSFLSATRKLQCAAGRSINGVDPIVNLSTATLLVSASKKSAEIPRLPRDVTSIDPLGQE